MKTLLTYIIEVIIISGILYSYYHFFLRNKKFHHYNRFYLLAASLVSIIIPFLNIPVYFNSPDQPVSEVLQTLGVTITPSFEDISTAANADPVAASGFNWASLIYVVYAFITCIVLTRIFISLIKIRTLIRKNKVEQLDNIRFVNTHEPGTPYSFFRFLFWNREIELRSTKGKQIFRHELFHIEQKHSYDVLYFEVLNLIFWINPFFHLIKKECRTIHEFLADQFAATENEKWEYAEHLLMHAFQTHQSFVNPFFHNQIKRRIAMITNSSKPRYQYLRKLMVLPLAAFALFLFAFSYRSKENAPASLNKSITVVIDAGHGANTGARIDNIYEDELMLSLAKKVQQLNEDKNITIVLTRDGNTNPSLLSRKETVEKNDADLFISLHMTTNGAVKTLGDRSNDGFTFYIPSKRDSKQSRLLAASLVKEIQSLYKTSATLKQTQQSIYVLEKPTVPAVMIECGNLSDKDDNAFMQNPSNQDKIAKAILQAITNFESEQVPSPTALPSDNQIIADTIKPTDKVFVKVEHEPTYPGGSEKWSSFLQSNLDATIPAKNGAAAGNYSVIVQFIVDLNGKVSDVRALTNFGFGMEAAAIELIKKSTWNPAIQNGRTVKAYHKVPIHFIISEDISDEKKLAVDSLMRNFEKVSTDQLKTISAHELLRLSTGTETKSFMITMDYANGKIVRTPNVGADFSDISRKILQSATPGRILTIEEIMVTENGTGKKMHGKIFLVVGQ